jgi:hypothetical protein
MQDVQLQQITPTLEDNTNTIDINSKQNEKCSLLTINLDSNAKTTIIIPNISKIVERTEEKYSNYQGITTLSYTRYFVDIYCGSDITSVELDDKDHMTKYHRNIERIVSAFYN